MSIVLKSAPQEDDYLLRRDKNTGTGRIPFSVRCRGVLRSRFSSPL